jgi:hypothetical protein
MEISFKLSLTQDLPGPQEDNQGRLGMAFVLLRQTGSDQPCDPRDGRGTFAAWRVQDGGT